MVKAEVEQAEQAAVEPANKKQSMAQAEQVSEMEEQETPAFNASAFVEALLQRVAAIMPKTNQSGHWKRPLKSVRTSRGLKAKR